MERDGAFLCMCVCVHVSTFTHLLWYPQMHFSLTSSGAGISSCAKMDSWSQHKAAGHFLQRKGRLKMFIFFAMIHKNSLFKKWYWQKIQSRRGYNNKNKHPYSEESFRISKLFSKCHIHCVFLNKMKRTTHVQCNAEKSGNNGHKCVQFFFFYFKHCLGFLCFDENNDRFLEICQCQVILCCCCCESKNKNRNHSSHASPSVIMKYNIFRKWNICFEQWIIQFKVKPEEKKLIHVHLSMALKTASVPRVSWYTQAHTQTPAHSPTHSNTCHTLNGSWTSWHFCEVQAKMKDLKLN